MSVTTTTCNSDQHQDFIVIDESRLQPSLFSQRNNNIVTLDSINSLDFVTFGRLLLRSADNNKDDETKKMSTLRCRLSNHPSIEESSTEESLENDTVETDSVVNSIHEDEIKEEVFNHDRHSHINQYLYMTGSQQKMFDSESPNHRSDVHYDVCVYLVSQSWRQ